MTGRCQSYREVYIPEADKEVLFYLTSRDPDDFFGEECILDRSPSFCTIATATAVTIFKLHKSAFQMVNRDRLAKFVENERHEFPTDDELRDRGYKDSIWGRYKHTQIKHFLKEGGKLRYLKRPQSAPVQERPPTEEKQYTENIYRFIQKGSLMTPVTLRSAGSRARTPGQRRRPMTAFVRSKPPRREPDGKTDTRVPETATETTDVGQEQPDATVANDDDVPQPVLTRRTSRTLMSTEKAREIEKQYTKIDCDLCKSSVELPRTTRSRRSIPATYANSRWQIDLKKMPPSRGYNYVCNIIDCFSRFSFGKPIKTKTSKEVADVVINYIYLFGAPRIIQSDNGREFRNSDLAAVVKEFEAVQMHGRPYHPQSQGRVERFNRTMTEYFRIKMAEDSNWPASLPAFYYSYNNRVNKSTRPSTPYQLFYKRPNFAAPLDEKVPYATLTPEEQAFLSTAHLDGDGGEDSDDEDITIEEALEEIDANTATPMSMPTLSPMVECSFGEEAESPRTPIQRHTSEHPIPSMSPVPVTPVPLRAGAIAVSQVPSTSAESPRHTSEQPVPSVSLVRVTTPPPVPLHGASAVSQGSSTSVNNDASMQEDVSPYYKEIYRRRFSDRDSLAMASEEALLSFLEAENAAFGRQLQQAWKADQKHEQQQNFMKNGVLVTMTSEDIVRKAKAVADRNADNWDADAAEKNEQDWDTILHAENKQARLLVTANKYKLKDLRKRIKAVQDKRERMDLLRFAPPKEETQKEITAEAET